MTDGDVCLKGRGRGKRSYSNENKKKLAAYAQQLPLHKSTECIHAYGKLTLLLLLLSSIIEFAFKNFVPDTTAGEYRF